MVEVCLLGTGGMSPSPYRYLTALYARCNGTDLLIDCGEGTQMALSKSGLSSVGTDIICITHFHADHVTGLPGFLLSMANGGRTKPVTIIGPKGLEKMVRSLCVVAVDLPFSIRYKEICENYEKMKFGAFEIEAFRVNHSIECYGYKLNVNRAGKFDVDRANKLGIPSEYWGYLQKGRKIEYNGVEYEPSMVLGEARKGIHVTYVTDTRPTDKIVEFAKDSDLFICEGMYGDESDKCKAIEKKHMTFMEAALIGREAAPDRMWLTHYSPSMKRPVDYLDSARAVFGNIMAARDGWNVNLNYKE